MLFFMLSPGEMGMGHRGTCILLFFVSQVPDGNPVIEVCEAGAL